MPHHLPAQLHRSMQRAADATGDAGAPALGRNSRPATANEPSAAAPAAQRPRSLSPCPRRSSLHTAPRGSPAGGSEHTTLLGLAGSGRARPASRLCTLPAGELHRRTSTLRLLATDPRTTTRDLLRPLYPSIRRLSEMTGKTKRYREGGVTCAVALQQRASDSTHAAAIQLRCGGAHSSGHALLRRHRSTRLDHGSRPPAAQLPVSPEAPSSSACWRVLGHRCARRANARARARHARADPAPGELNALNQKLAGYVVHKKNQSLLCKGVTKRRRDRPHPPLTDRAAGPFRPIFLGNSKFKAPRRRSRSGLNGNSAKGC